MTSAGKLAAVALAAGLSVGLIVAATTSAPRARYKVLCGDATYYGTVTERGGTHVIHTTDGRMVEYQGSIVIVRED